MRFRRAAVLPLLILVLAGAAADADQAIDGNTLEIQGQRVRLFGIDAFEPGQTCLDAGGQPWRCGAAAEAALAELIQDHGVACTVIEEDDPEQYVARCTVRDEVDVGSYMVGAGLALADPAASGEYADAEAAARQARAGAWAGTFTRPWDWREQQAKTR